VNSIDADQLLEDSEFLSLSSPWEMLIQSTQPGEPLSALTVHFVGFESMGFGRFSRNILAGKSSHRRLESSLSYRQAEFAFGRLAARHALTRFSRALSDTSVPTGDNREPLWPDGILGSITHISGLTGAAVVPKGPWRYLGIDIEQTALGNAQRALRTLVIDSAEFALLNHVCEEAHQPSLARYVTHVFSAKECLFKAAFPSVRRFFGFSAAQLCGFKLLSGGRGPEARLTLEIVQGVGGEFITGSRWCIEVWRLPTSDTYLSVLAY
jgi:4'-phosphopantetheinyl transferase EntD|tara:strand:- start:593 stop:1393 length:801 start_codon:yes stop_codon:yes gene_type:complete